MANLRQSILIRTDLGFPVGLLAAQVAHIHFEGIRRKLLDAEKPTKDEKEWLETPYIYVHGARNQETLMYYVRKARDLGVPVNIWNDTVYVKMSETQMEAFPNVNVGVSLGPCDSDKIKAVIGDLPLL